MFLAALLALSFPSGAAAQDEDSREALARIEAVARRTIEKEGVPGLAIAVMSGSETWISKGWGYGDAEHRLVATGEMLFPIASVGRQLTAAAILKLAEAHKLALDDPLERWLPGFPSEIRLRHMLAGTSGIAGPGAWIHRNPELLLKPVSADEFVSLLRGLPLEFAPGTSFSSESSGYALLSVVVSKAAGEPYAAYVAGEVLSPLGLDEIRVCPADRRAIGFAGDCEHSAGEGDFDLPLQAESAGFGQHWCASVGDLVRFERGLVDRSLLEESSVRALTTPVDLAQGRSTGHGFAMEIGMVEGVHVFSHTGGSGGFRVRTTHYVEPDITVAVLANCHSAPVERIESEVARAVLGWAPREILEMELPAEARDRYCGTYQLATTRIRISLIDGHMRFEGPEQSFALLYQGRHVFASAAEKDVWVKFQVEGGKATSFTWLRAGDESTARRME